MRIGEVLTMAKIELKRRVKYAGDVHAELLKAGWDCCTAAEFLNNIPDADVVPVRHGRWLCVDTDTEQFFLCNRCKKKEYWESNYCPNCGCKMDLEG